MKRAVLKDIIGWDLVNWSKAISFWENHAVLDRKKMKCLELGSNQGGLSIWLAQKGHQVICSDLKNPEQVFMSVHKNYMDLDISFQAINALDIPFENEFDIVIFKSILGGISRNGNNLNKSKVLNEIHKALKPGGKLLFAENLIASPLHQFFRKKYVGWGNEWYYLKLSEINNLLKTFTAYHFKTAGFFGAFGRTETQRSILGRVDTVLELFLPKKQQYIIFGVAEK